MLLADTLFLDRHNLHIMQQPFQLEAPLPGSTRDAHRVTQRPIVSNLLLLVWLAGIIKEIAIMRMLQDHPHVIKLQDVFEDDTHFYLVMDLCSGGELFDQIINKGHFTERDAAVIMRALLDVMAYAHSKHIVHRYELFGRDGVARVLLLRCRKMTGGVLSTV
jgi:serine/threonine protein kinase